MKMKNKQKNGQKDMNRQFRVKDNDPNIYEKVIVSLVLKEM